MTSPVATEQSQISLPSHRAKIALVYYSFAVIAVLALNYFALPQRLLTEESFHNWDARSYIQIRDDGYSVNKELFFKRIQAKYRVAFFPLFPMMWRLLDVNAIAMSVINGLLFISSFLLLARMLNFQGSEFLLCLSVPGAIFFFLPYTESTFFFTSTLLLLGLKSGNKYLTCIGILLSSISRPAFTVFVPVIILLELLTGKNIRDASLSILIYLLMFAIAFLLVGLIQYRDTGEWFKFLTAQKHWGAQLRLPELPIRTFQGGIILLLDGAALLTGLISSVILIAAVLKNKVREISKPVLFSLLYVAGISFAVIIFRGGDLFSLNRFVFATPFFFVLLHSFITHSMKFNPLRIFLIMALLFVFWIPFDAYQSLSSLLPFLCLTGYLILYALLKTEVKHVQIASFSTIVLMNLALQIYLYFRFLSGGWVA